MAYPNGYWAELVRSTSSVRLNESATGRRVWLRTSDGEPLEQQAKSTISFFDIGTDTDEPDYLVSVDSSFFYRFRKSGEDWIPSDDGIQISSVPWNSQSSYRFFEVLSNSIPNFSDDTGDAVTWIQGTSITNIIVPAATGTPTPTYAVVGTLPDGIIFTASTRTLSGTPTSTGSGTITIRATNSEGNDDWTMDYNIQLAAGVPNFVNDTGDAVAWAIDGSIRPITIPAATGNPAPTYAVVGDLPDGIVIDLATLRITGTPTTIGSGTITIRATNSEGNDDWTMDYSVTYLVHEFTITAEQINQAAVGRFGGLTETFYYDGQNYEITHCFTHANGFQLRFDDNAQALAFIAADFSVDSDIAGQNPFLSSIMENVIRITAAQYRTFTGRFTANIEYTIQITIQAESVAQIRRMTLGTQEISNISFGTQSVQIISVGNTIIWQS